MLLNFEILVFSLFRTGKGTENGDCFIFYSTKCKAGCKFPIFKVISFIAFFGVVITTDLEVQS